MSKKSRKLAVLFLIILLFLSAVVSILLYFV